MFEALFILTTIDAGTRISRFLLQEMLGSIYPPLGRPNWLPGALGTSVAVTAGWAGLVWTGSIGTIWPMFGIANQLLAVLALALVTTWLVNTGRGRYAWVTLLPMAFVTTTTLTAASQMLVWQVPALAADGKPGTALLSTVLTVFVVVSVCTLMVLAASRWLAVAGGMIPVRSEKADS
jgi:carbon starvation protein